MEWRKKGNDKHKICNVTTWRTLRNNLFVCVSFFRFASGMSISSYLINVKTLHENLMRISELTPILFFERKTTSLKFNGVEILLLT